MTLLSEKENEAASRFVWEHYNGGCGDRAKLELTAEATGIGFTINVRCPKCKKTQDVTDTGNW
jgi:hypothetical protein